MHFLLLKNFVSQLTMAMQANVANNDHASEANDGQDSETNDVLANEANHVQF